MGSQPSCFGTSLLRAGCVHASCSQTLMVACDMIIVLRGVFSCVRNNWREGEVGFYSTKSGLCPGESWVEHLRKKLERELMVEEPGLGWSCSLNPPCSTGTPGQGCHMLEAPAEDPMWGSFLQGPQKPQKPKAGAGTAWAAPQHLPSVPGHSHREQQCPTGSTCSRGFTADIALWAGGCT